MDVYGKDMIIGDFKLSDFGLMLGSFSADGEDEEELGMGYETIEEFIGHRPVPVYLGAKYSEKLEPVFTIIKNPCTNNNLYFTEHECREVLRQLTGFRGYKRMQILTDEFEELLYFNVRIVSASYQKVAGKVAGIVLSGECDSQFAWSKPYRFTYNLKANKEFTFINVSDDLYNYLLPKMTIKSSSAITDLDIINITDNNWTTTIESMSSGETITIDSKTGIVTSSIPGRNALDAFNMHFPRIVTGRNRFVCNKDITLTLEYVLPRKVGFL